MIRLWSDSTVLISEISLWWYEFWRSSGLKWMFSSAKCDWNELIDVVQFYSMTMLSHMLPIGHCRSSATRYQEDTAKVQPHVTRMTLQKFSHTLPGWHCKRSATCYQDDTAKDRPHVTRMTLQKFGHTLPGWHCRSSATRYQNDTAKDRPHVTRMTLQKFSHTLPGWHCRGSATRYQDDTAEVRPHVTRMTLQKIGHTLPGGHCKSSATRYQNDTAKDRPHVTRMTLQKFGHTFPEWHCKISLTCDMKFCHIHHILLIYYTLTTIFSNVWRLFMLKTLRSKGELETAFKDFLASKNSEFYYTCINNIVYWLQKFIDVQGSYFD